MKLKPLSLLLLTLYQPAGYADGDIELRIRLDTQLEATRALIGLSIANSGSAPVLDIRPELRTAPRLFRFPYQPKLLPGSSYQRQLSVSLPAEIIRNQFYLPVFIGYTDKVGERINTVALAHFRTREDIQENYTINLKALSVDSGCTQGTVEVENLQTHQGKLSLEIITATEFSIKPEKQQAMVPQRGQISLPFELCNRTGVSAGQFPVYAIATETGSDNGVQTAATGILGVNITSLPSRFFRNSRLIHGLAIGALLLLGIFGLQRFLHKPDRT